MGTPNVGIDIGTTTSALATVDDEATVSEGECVSVSTVISFEGEHAVVGESARERAVSDPLRTVRSFKRLLGTDERVSVVVEGQPREYTPEELTALVLTKLRRTAGAETGGGHRLGRAVVTVPVTFTARQRRALCHACEIAGIDVARLMAEPTAAALAHGAQTGLDGTILVYDLGGGGFDAALINVTDGVFDVLGTHGDPWVGGDAFDAEIVEWLDLHLERKHGIRIDSDPIATERLFVAARTAKHALVSHTSTTITATLEQGGQSYGIRQPLHRNQLERRTRGLVARTVSVCEELLDGVGFDEERLDGLLFVGGVTELPFVRERITDRFGHAGERLGETTTALGGATRAAVVEEPPVAHSGATTRFIPQETVVLDATPHSISLESTRKDGDEDRLIPNNVTVPTRTKAVVTTATDRQQYVVVPVYYDRTFGPPREQRYHRTGPDRSTDRTATDRSMDGNSTSTTSTRADERRVTSGLLDAFRIGPLRPRRAGVPSIEVTFEFDPNGIVHAHAEDLDRDGTIETTAIYRRTETEIKTMKQEQPSVR